MLKNVLLSPTGIIAFLLVLLCACNNFESYNIEEIGEETFVKINQFASLQQINSSSEKTLFVSYDISRDSIEYKFSDMDKSKCMMLPSNVQLLGFAGKSMIFTSFCDSLFVLDLVNAVFTSYPQNIKNARFLPAMTDRKNSSANTYYANCIIKNINTVRFNGEEDIKAYSEMLNQHLSDDCIVEIKLKNDKLFIDTLLSGFTKKHIFRDQGYGNPLLGIEDFGDSLCVFTPYSDSIFFYNKTTESLRAYKIKSEMKQICIETAPFDLLKNSSEFSRACSERILYGAGISDVERNLQNEDYYVFITHAVPKENTEQWGKNRNWNWLVYKNNKLMAEEEFSGLLNPSGSIIAGDTIMVENDAYEKDIARFTAFYISD